MDNLSTALAFIDGLGAPEMLLIFVLVLVLFGGNKLPEFARGLGKTMREFKKAAAGVEEEFKRALDEDERKQNAAKYEPPAALPAGASPAASATDPAGPHGTTDHPHYDEYGHEYYENQDGHASTAPDPADPHKPGAATPAAAAAPVADPAAPTASDGPSPAPIPPAPPAAAPPPAGPPPGESTGKP